MKTDHLSERATLETRAASFIYNIKYTTAASHLRLESQALLSALMMPDVTRHQYYCYLSLMKHIEDVFEKNIIAPFAGTFAGVEKGRALQLISDDLNDINSAWSNTLEFTDYHLPATISIPFAMGFKYVMEGSKLGGKVIYKHIHRTLGYSESRGAKFISDYGADTFRQWKAFLSGFSMYVIENDCEAEAIQGAEYAFSSIHNFFESNKSAYEI